MSEDLAKEFSVFIKPRIDSRARVNCVEWVPTIYRTNMLKALSLYFPSSGFTNELPEHYEYSYADPEDRYRLNAIDRERLSMNSKSDRGLLALINCKIKEIIDFLN